MAAEPRSRQRFRILSIVGTRPEAIKMAPVARALAARRDVFEHGLLLTGQHRELAPFFGDLAPETLRQLHYDPSNRTPAKLRESLHALLHEAFREDLPHLVLVHGDTTSALAAAFAAHDAGVPIGHVEAGLRSFDYDQPRPEEGNRVAIDAMSALLFAPTAGAAANLAKEWRVKGEVVVTGNTGIDQLFHARGPKRPAAAGAARKTIVVTCHRKENQGEPTAMLCGALTRIARLLPLDIVLPLHPNRHVRAPIEEALSGEPGIRLVEPLDYAEMVALLDQAWLIVTDSGGLQEEGSALGKPVLVLREVTERPEAVAGGNAELIGTDEDAIVAAVGALFADEAKYARMARPSDAFGDGRAAERIVGAIETWLRGPPQAPVTRLSRSTNRPRAASTSA